MRGASNAVFGLDDAQAAKGVATHSSGNHASCLSYAAMLRGIPCNVVMPRTAPQAKKDTVRRYGGRITECEPSTSSREATFAKVQEETGGDFVHPYNDPRVIAGQGTTGLEIAVQAAEHGIDTADVLVCCGGGGLTSGIALALEAEAPGLRVRPAEPEEFDDVTRSLAAGEILSNTRRSGAAPWISSTRVWISPIKVWPERQSSPHICASGLARSTTSRRRMT